MTVTDSSELASKLTIQIPITRTRVNNISSEISEPIVTNVRTLVIGKGSKRLRMAKSVWFS